MTDEELCKRMRLLNEVDAFAAADRIEELLRERQAHHANPADFRYWEGRYRDEKANLAKAAGALTRIASAQPRPMRSGGYEGHDVSNMQRTARTTLAEIGGE